MVLLISMTINTLKLSLFIWICHGEPPKALPTDPPSNLQKKDSLCSLWWLPSSQGHCIPAKDYFQPDQLEFFTSGPGLNPALSGSLTPFSAIPQERLGAREPEKQQPRLLPGLGMTEPAPAVCCVSDLLPHSWSGVLWLPTARACAVEVWGKQGQTSQPCLPSGQSPAAGQTWTPTINPIVPPF